MAALPAAAGSIPYKLILVDNPSPEGEAFYQNKELLQDVLVLHNKENMGFPLSCNRGFAAGRSPLVLFLNDDVILDPGSIEYLVKDLDDLIIGAVGAKLVFPDDVGSRGLNTDIRPPGKIQHVGIMTNIVGEFVHSFIGWDENHPKPNAMRETYAVTGACLMTRRSLFTKAGGFDPGYGLGTYEDVDYCLTIRDMGYNVVVNTQARGLHYVGATAESYKMPYPMDLNRLKFMHKWATRLNYTEWNIW